MANKYVLGPNAARQLKRLIRGTGEIDRRQDLAATLAFDSDYVLPYTVQWAQSLGESGSWIIWLPSSEELVVDGNAVEITGGGSELEAAGGDYPSGWFILAGLPDVGGDLYLNVYFPDNGERDPENAGGAVAAGSSAAGSDNSEPAVRADIDRSPGSDSNEETCRSILIASVARENDGTVRVIQNVVGAILVNGINDEIGVDEVSVDRNGGDDDSGDLIQLAHFNDTDQDSGRGLAARFTVDTESGEISLKSRDSLMLVGRKNGKICYIPLGREKGEDPDPDPDDEDDSGPCDHDPGGGSHGGVSPENELIGGAGGGGGGGVAAEGGEPHRGDDDCRSCNCN